MDDEIHLFPENIEAFGIFLQMTTQWIFSGMGVATGLSYPALEVVLKLNRVKDRMDCFARIRILERRTLELRSKEKNGSTA